VEQAALKAGYQVMLGNSERDPERERRYTEELWSHGIRGLIAGSSLLALTHLSGFVKNGLHIVTFDRQAQSADDLPVDSVTMDNALATQLATEHLLSLGHRRIGFVTGPMHTVNRRARLEGYMDALSRHGVGVDESLIWEKSLEKGYGDVEGIALGRSGARELLSGANPPTAIVAINDTYAFGAYSGARDLGLRVPTDVSIVGIDDIVLAEIVDPPLTTVRQPLSEMTEAAVSCVIGRIEGRKTGEPEHLTMIPELVVRSSTSAPRS
jgi:DNA-binding LacI/PurR family transcriptional regulator